MKTLFTAALLALCLGCASGNSSLLPLPRMDTVEYDGKTIHVDGWVNFRSVDVPYVVYSKGASFTLRGAVPLTLPIFTEEVKEGLARIGLAVDTEEDEGRIAALIIAETGL